MAGLDDAEECHVPSTAPVTHLGNSSRRLANLMDFAVEVSLMHHEQGVGVIVLFTQNGIKVWAEKLGLKWLVGGWSRFSRKSVCGSQ